MRVGRRSIIMNTLIQALRAFPSPLSPPSPTHSPSVGKASFLCTPEQRALMGPSR